jgi:transcriptional regulator with XRE-family HTH domain
VRPTIDEVDWERASWQLLRALRRDRSQKELSRLLGYRSNVVSNWETRRRFPTAQRTLEICGTVGIDVLGALATFMPECAIRFQTSGVASWLEALRRGKPVATLAQASGRSRHTIARWLKGQTRPRLPDFLMLVQVITGRLPELLNAFHLFNDVPELAALEARLRVARRAAVLESVGR